jgi:hypothetical protein
MLLLDSLQGLNCGRTLVRALKVSDEHVTYLVLVVHSTFEQVDEPRSSCAGQCRGQIVGFYPIVSSGGLNDRVIDLDEFFRIAGSVILVDRFRLELVRTSDLPEP